MKFEGGGDARLRTPRGSWETGGGHRAQGTTGPGLRHVTKFAPNKALNLLA